ncbi:MAG: LPS export ABC transporter periplasmic protein LptC [Candidatus Lambdaproteobacteria bacterium]|nr:LPS export ABC transporter periplasmic protein LptC [Candidatus Lambdaproteobacteria bacterium]
MRRLLLFIGFMTLGTLLIYVFTVQEGPVDDVELPLDLPRNQMRLGDVVVEEQDGGVVAYRLWAREAAHREQSQLTLLTDVRIVIYPRPDAPPDEPAITGTADKAVLNGREQLLLMDENVVIHRGTDTTLRSERVVYRHKTRQVIAPRRFWLQDKSTTHTGVRMDYDLDSQRVSIASPLLQQ